VPAGLPCSMIQHSEAGAAARLRWLWEARGLVIGKWPLAVAERWQSDGAQAACPGACTFRQTGERCGGNTLGAIPAQRCYHHAMPAPQRVFPPPWSIEQTDACFIVRDASGQAVGYVYCEDEPGRRSAAHLCGARRGAPDSRQHHQAAGLVRRPAR
jgi:hypothetical protein